MLQIVDAPLPSRFAVALEVGRALLDERLGGRAGGAEQIDLIALQRREVIGGG